MDKNISQENGHKVKNLTKSIDGTKVIDMGSLEDNSEKEKLDIKDNLDLSYLKDIENKKIEIKEGKIINVFNFQDAINIMEDMLGNIDVSPRSNKSHGDQIKEKKGFNLIDDSQFLDFIEKYSGTKLFIVSLVVACLEVVSIDQLPELADSLETMIYSFKEKPSINTNEAGFYISMGEIISTLCLEIVDIDIKDKIGKIRIESVRYQESILTKEIAIKMWKELPQIRIPIVKWLIEIINSCQKHIIIRAINALINFSKLDFYYSVNYIIDPLLDRLSNINIFTITIILQKIALEEKFRENLDELLISWLNGNYVLLIPICDIYCINLEGRYRNKIYSSLDRFIEACLSNMRISYKEQIINFLSSQIHHSQELLEIVIDIFTKNFNNSKMIKEKRRIAYLYLEFIMGDFFVVSKEIPYLKLFEILNDKRLYNKISYLILFICSEKELRDVFYFILKTYLNEFDKYNKSIDKLKPLFICMAFTGEKYDYVNVMSVLKELIDDKHHSNGTAKKIYEYLSKKLSEYNNSEYIK